MDEPAPDSKYVIAVFNVKTPLESVEAAPISWLVTKTKMKWPDLPKRYSKEFEKMRRDCTKPKDTKWKWNLVECRILGYAATLLRAREKAKLGQEQSNVDTDDNDSAKNKRAASLPERYRQENSEREDDRENPTDAETSDDDEASTNRDASSENSSLSESDTHTPNIDDVEEDVPSPPSMSHEEEDPELVNDRSKDSESTIGPLIDLNEPSTSKKGSYTSRPTLPKRKRIEEKSPGVKTKGSHISSPASSKRQRTEEKSPGAKEKESAPATPSGRTPLSANHGAGSASFIRRPGDGKEKVYKISADGLQKLLTTMETIKETQALHTSYLTSLLREARAAPAESEIPEGVRLPLETKELFMDLDNHLKDQSKLYRFVNWLADLGGKDLEDVINRMLRRLLSDNLAPYYCRRGGGKDPNGTKKESFEDKLLYNAVYRAVKKNPVTAKSTQREVELAVGSWFNGARDRGEESRANRAKAEAERRAARENTN